MVNELLQTGEDFRPLHPLSVGLQTVPTGERLVSGDPPTQSAQQRTIQTFIPKREAQQRNTSAFVEPQEPGRCRCRQKAA